MAEQRPVHDDDHIYRLLCDQTRFGMVATDLGGRIVTWSQAASRMFGSNAEQMIGTDWTSFIPAEGRETATGMMKETLENSETDEFEFWHRDERGRRRDLAAVISPLMDAAGIQIGALVCIRDVTKRVALENRVAQQGKMAAMGEMAGAFSHHLNNILGGVVTSIDFALASGDPGTLTRVLEKTQQALTRATTLMGSLAKFAEGDPKEADLCDLGEVIIDLIEHTERKVRDHATGRNTAIGLDVNLKFLPVLEVPGTQLLTVLSNVVDNAIEAMPDGGALSIEVDAEESHAVIRIGDTGCGLDEESVTRIFEPFFRASKDHSQVPCGRGLGLAVAHGILKVLGGSMNVLSKVGEGSVFEILLPLNAPPLER